MANSITASLFSVLFPMQRPNVCTNQEVSMLGIRQPCVQGFTRMVKVWKQGCTGHRWCVGYERRTTYYTAYRQAYSMDFHTVYQCCPGWTQKNNEMGCLHRVCSANACLNGGRCIEMGNHVCRCPLGFKGLQCQYDPGWKRGSSLWDFPKMQIGEICRLVCQALHAGISLHLANVCSSVNKTDELILPSTRNSDFFGCVIPRKHTIMGLNDYRPVNLMSVVIKSFEQLVLKHLKDTTGTNCWTPCSLLTGQTGQQMMQSVWDYTSSCTTSTIQGHMPGSCL
ncbi:hypothetical protein ATANTOWER_015645 [Ataeniobius toweri]|uniref:EGF-like domain-containing protein n=1 Tax=Ataeniobius toweri TaxID=208326 RepID=A0ABU7ASH3_9TELE|nr:hypothetical protein [Ataeniobius toweri]